MEEKGINFKLKIRKSVGNEFQFSQKLLESPVKAHCGVQICISIKNFDNNCIYPNTQTQLLMKSPQFNRYISLKKKGNTENIQHFEKILTKMHEAINTKSTRKNIQQRFNRRELHFMRKRRPDHNSPVKTRIQNNNGNQQQDSSSLNSKKDALSVEDQQQNALMIKQMVTHLRQSRRTVRSDKSETTTKYQGKQQYYVSEIVENSEVVGSLAREHILDSVYFLQILGKYFNPQYWPQIQTLSLKKKAFYKDKITVVLDLDETLVHCFEQLSQPHQISLPVTFSGGRKMIAPVNFRPGAKQFLKQLFQDFELIIFTASDQPYANEVINYLDPKKQMIQHRLFRRNCQYISQGFYVKDLRLLGRDLSQLVLVDNAAYSYCFQVDNGIPILPYYKGSHDFELKLLKDYLYSLIGVKDVRQVNHNITILQMQNSWSKNFISECSIIAKFV